VITENNILLIF